MQAPREEVFARFGFQNRGQVAAFSLRMKRKTAITLTGGVALVATAAAAIIALRPVHPLQQHRWADTYRPGNCGIGPPRTMEFGRDGIARYFVGGSSTPATAPYSISGNRIIFGSGADRREGEYTLAGDLLSVRMIGTTGREGEDYTSHYVADVE